MRTLSVLMLLSLFLGQALAEEHRNLHHSKSESAGHGIKSLFLNNGKKWSVDQTMRENMEAINIELQKTNVLISLKKETNNDFLKLSDVVSSSSQNIVSKCRMAEKQDETFHTVLGELLAGAEDLKDVKKTKHGVARLNKAIVIYSKYFEHSFSK